MSDLFFSFLRTGCEVDKNVFVYTIHHLSLKTLLWFFLLEVWLKNTHALCLSHFRQPTCMVVETTHYHKIEVQCIRFCTYHEYLLIILSSFGLIWFKGNHTAFLSHSPHLVGVGILNSTLTMRISFTNRKVIAVLALTKGIIATPTTKKHQQNLTYLKNVCNKHDYPAQLCMYCRHTYTKIYYMRKEAEFTISPQLGIKYITS
jgi:hypothetical protein